MAEQSMGVDFILGGMVVVRYKGMMERLIPYRG